MENTKSVVSGADDSSNRSIQGSLPTPYIFDDRSFEDGS